MNTKMTRIERYKYNLEVRKSGKYIGLPLFKIYPKLGKFIPAIIPELTMIVFAASGNGKTQFYKRMILELAKAHKEGKINSKPLFLINLLEETKDEFEDSLVGMLYYDKYKKDIFNKKIKKISKLKLNSYTEEFLSDEELLRVTSISNDLDSILADYVILEDNIYNPTGLYYKVRDISRTIGTHYYTHLIPKDTLNLDYISHTEFSELDKIEQLNFKWSHYTKNDPDVYPVVITDHIARLYPENGESLRETMAKWSFEYCRKQISKNMQFSVINIMQQTVYSESKSYSFKNELNIEGLKPTLADLGDSKTVAQDHHVVLSIFNPDRYMTDGDVDGIDMARANGRYRSVIINKNRIGPDQAEIPFYFDGQVAAWNELDKSNIDTFYIIAKID